MKNFNFSILIISLLVFSSSPCLATFSGRASVGKTKYKVTFASLDETQNGINTLVVGAASIKRTNVGSLSMYFDFPKQIYNQLKTGDEFNLISTGDDSDIIENINFRFIEAIYNFDSDEIEILTETNVDSNARGSLKILSYSSITRKLRVELKVNVTNYLKEDETINKPINITMKSLITLPEPTPETPDDYGEE